MNPTTSSHRARDDGRPAPSAEGGRGGGDEPWHALEIEEVASRLEVDPGRGLSPDEAARRGREYGPNALAGVAGRSPLAILLSQFASLIVGLLVAATALAFALGEMVEGVAILIVVVLNALIGFFTEWRAERALAALQEQSVAKAHVLRDGREREIPAAELVPGDVILLAAGARVPADGRLIEAARLLIEEAALTGESAAVEKSAGRVEDPAAAIGDRTDMAYMGTAVTDGRGRALVTAIGAETEVGRIGTLIGEAPARETPLERKLAQLGHALVGVVLAFCAVIVVAGYLRGHALLPMLEIGITLAIAAVPEGLPAVATMTLALGMQRMARKRALIRRLPAVETLGSTTVICTDKTGTLTKNEMTVRAYDFDGQPVEVGGAGYDTEGKFTRDGSEIDPHSDPRLELALRIGLLCNDATLETRDGRPAVLGDPTEGALVVAGIKAGLDPEALKRDYPRKSEIPFDSESKRMVTVHEAPGGKLVAYAKGSPGALVEGCRSLLAPDGVVDLSPEDRERIIDRNRDLAAKALRVLALAYRDLEAGSPEGDAGRDLTFVGLVGMADPLREEARDAIATCRDAGIRVVMITGDQPMTAAEIARQLGIDRDAGGEPLHTVHARDLKASTPEEWERVAGSAAVFARVSPEHKLRIVEGLQRGGGVVAMTGDGVNDAPALKTADIGIAMGIKGTEVAKETADMVITDDNFATIVGAIEQGRMIYANIRKFIHYLFSCNLSEILVVFVAILIGWPSPLAPLQLLWLNMITDVFPALALALEPSAPGMMKQPPRDPNEKLLNPRFSGLIAWQAAVLAAATLASYAIGLAWHGGEAEGGRIAMTIAFMTLALAQVFHAFNARSRRRSAFTAQLFSNGWLWAAVAACLLLQVAAVSVPLLQRVLRTAMPGPADWGLIVACSLVPIVVAEAVKLAARWMQPRAT